jgi:predicted AlkP superfamily pyrophosphatase or phosphodiesterase
MLTGVSPGSHGIVSNRTFDPLDDDLEGWRWYAEDVKRDPVWRLVEQSGYHAALVGWPVTVGAKVTWLAPEYWRARNRNDPKLLRALSTPGLLEGVGKEHADFWTRLSPSDPKDDALTDIAIHVLANGRPNFLALHLVQVDGAQHHFGLWSPEAVAAIEDDDRQLARIFELLYSSGMARDTRVIVASDHGFMNAPTLVKPGVLLREAGLVRLDDKAHVVDWAATALVNGGQAYIYVKDAHDATTREALRKLFAAQVADPQGVVARVYEAADIAAIGGDPDAFLAIEARPGFQFGPGYGGALVGPAKYRATHGYDPRRPEMHASLLMFGPDIPHGTIEGARLVDVGPTVAAWLGIPMLGVEGHPLVVASAK